MGYLNFTLSYFNTSDLDRGDGAATVTANTNHPAICRLDKSDQTEIESIV